MENYLDTPKKKPVTHHYRYFIDDDNTNTTDNLQLIKDIYYYYYLPKNGKGVLYQEDENGNRTKLYSTNFFENTELIYITLEQFYALLYFINEHKSTKDVNSYWIELACDVVGVNYEECCNDEDAVKKVISVWNSFYIKYFDPENYDSKNSKRFYSMAIRFGTCYRISSYEIKNNMVKELNHEWKRRIRQEI